MYIYYLSHSTLALSFSTYLLVLLAMLLLATGVLWYDALNLNEIIIAFTFRIIVT